jgi:NAD(P)-dependent dehydrogenase (short-subunit alcohol dehydrogenase family)
MLADRGSAVALTYHRNAEAAAAVVADVERAGRRARASTLDMVDADATAQFIESVADEFGGIHTVVHAAGPHVPQIHLSRVPPAQFREQLDAEVAAFFNLVQPALRHLRKTQGSLIAVTTAATRRYPVRDGLSAGPKGAIEALVRAFAAEEGRFGVRANCVGPGMLTDGMAQRLMASGDLDDEALAVTRRNIALRRFGDAADIAEAVCFLASDRADFISGQMLDVDGGYGI